MTDVQKSAVDTVMYDAEFQRACQSYAHGNGSSGRIARAALAAMPAASEQKPVTQADNERAAIVAFVRGLNECDDEDLRADLDFDEVADRIERQDHHCQCMEVYGENPACPVKHETDGVEYGA